MLKERPDDKVPLEFSESEAVEGGGRIAMLETPRYTFLYILPDPAWGIPPAGTVEADSCPGCSSTQVVHVQIPEGEARHFCIACFFTWAGCVWKKP